MPIQVYMCIAQHTGKLSADSAISHTDGDTFISEDWLVCVRCVSVFLQKRSRREGGGLYLWLRPMPSCIKCMSAWVWDNSWHLWRFDWCAGGKKNCRTI